MKRIALFVFHDNDGYVGDYVKYYIKSLNEVAEKIIFIVNGEIQSEGKKNLEDLGVYFFQRNNVGWDFGAWKEVIIDIGFQIIATYDELILCNSSCYGPIYPLSDVFAEMEMRNCDFWGITKHPATGNLVISRNPESAIVEYIHSYFIVFSNKVIKSKKFKEWWTNLKQSSSYLEELAFHENKFTQYLSHSGFCYDTYVNCDKYFEISSSFDPTFIFAPEFLSNEKDPFINRRLFINCDYIWTNVGEGFTPEDTLAKISCTPYPISYLFSDLLRNRKISELKDCLSLTWIPSFIKTYTSHHLALVCYAYYVDLAKYMSSYIFNMPNGSDLYLISSKQEVLDTYKKIIEEKNVNDNFKKIQYMLKPNRGRDVSALLVTAAPYLKKYDAFCFIHDKKSKHVPYTVAHDFLRRCLSCCLNDKTYVKNLVESLLNKTMPCGVMLPPTPFFSFFTTLGSEAYGVNSVILKKLFTRLNLHVPYDDKLIAPFGTMFWARPEALTDLLNYPWRYDDFPDEPMPIDFTISHAIERVICFCAQNRGYFSKWALPPEFAGLYINNLAYRIRDYNRELFRIFNLNHWVGMLNVLKNFTIKTQNKNEKSCKTFSYVTYLRYKFLFKFLFGLRKEHYRKKYFDLKRIKHERRIKFF